MKYSCDEDNISPPLVIEDVPENAKSLALVIDDPDASSGDFTHWIVWNISPDTREIKENSLPEGAAEGLNDFGKTGYGGPCPPQGEHSYNFRLYALDDALELSELAQKVDLETEMNAHLIDRALLIGRYKRPHV